VRIDPTEKDGFIFRQLREASGLSRKEAADKLGCSRSTIYRLERAKGVPITVLDRLGDGIFTLNITGVDKHGNVLTFQEIMEEVHKAGLLDNV
jgi:transcriptional regulator with XRE-family HTH domain